MATHSSPREGLEVLHINTVCDVRYPGFTYGGWEPYYGLPCHLNVVTSCGERLPTFPLNIVFAFLFFPEDGSGIFVRNVERSLPDYNRV